ASERNVSGGGRSAGSPCGAPASTHLTMVAISASLSERSFLYCRMPTVLSRCHGGISRLATRWRIERAHGRTSSYETSDLGADVPGWRQDWQLFWKTGA